MPYSVDQILIGIVFQIAIVAALAAWGRWVARRRGDGIWWQRAASMPWIAFAFGTLGMGVGIYFLIDSFAAVAHDAPSEKATRLAQGISRAMNWSAPLMVLSIACYVGCVIAFAIGSAADQRPDTPGGRS